jgi:hypothetical protein
MQFFWFVPPVFCGGRGSVFHEMKFCFCFIAKIWNAVDLGDTTWVKMENKSFYFCFFDVKPPPNSRYSRFLQSHSPFLVFKQNPYPQITLRIFFPNRCVKLLVLTADLLCYASYIHSARNCILYLIQALDLFTCWRIHAPLWMD